VITSHSNGRTETQTLAGLLAPLLTPGDVLCLHGDLGAGKTTWTQGLVGALGSPALVSSPTFTLLHEYGGGRLPVYHVDAYRLTGASDAETIGLDDYLGRGDGVLVVEWPERIADALPPDRLDITLSDDGADAPAVTSENNDETRRITLRGGGARWANLADEWAAATGTGGATC